MGAVHQHCINRDKGAKNAKISMQRHSHVLCTNKLWAPVPSQKHSMLKHVMTLPQQELLSDLFDNKNI